MSLGPVFITAADLHGPFTRYPTASLAEMMRHAAQRAMDSASLLPHQIDAAYFGAAGHFVPEGFVGTLPAQLAHALKIENAQLSPMQVGTSETGAWTLLQAYRWVQQAPVNEPRRALVVAGEQMDPVASAEAWRDRTWAEQQRQARAEALSRIVGEPERKLGLSMLRIGDLLMDLWATLHRLTPQVCRNDLLPTLALAKYERAQGYTAAQFFGRPIPSLSAYQALPLLTPYFNLHDATPTSSGAAAVILSNHPGVMAVQIAGMGQASASPSLCDRPGDAYDLPHVRKALARACAEAGIDTSSLTECDFVQLHDAFPSIELLFLEILGFRSAEVRDRVLSGWSNPLGGLKGGGHALAASGLFQVVQAAHLMSGDLRYLSPAAPTRYANARRVLTTSVGGALTQVVATLLTCEQSAPSRSVATPPVSELDRRFCEEVRHLPPGHGVVLAATRLLASANPPTSSASASEPWVLWMQCRGSIDASAKALVLSPHDMPRGYVITHPDLP
jgi:acetyl-CoA acetyltransferase